MVKAIRGNSSRGLAARTLVRDMLIRRTMTHDLEIRAALDDDLVDPLATLLDDALQCTRPGHWKSRVFLARNV
jgi:hypothetical protein